MRGAKAMGESSGAGFAIIAVAGFCVPSRVWSARQVLCRPELRCDATSLSEGGGVEKRRAEEVDEEEKRERGSGGRTTSQGSAEGRSIVARTANASQGSVMLVPGSVVFVLKVERFAIARPGELS